MPDKLGRLLFEFSARVRRYRTSEMARLEAMAALSQRDLSILEFVAEKGQASFAEVAQELNFSDLPGRSASSVSQAIGALYAKHGLVEKRPNPQDQRQPIITLTEKGEAIVESSRQLRAKVLAQVKSAMELNDSDAAVLEKAFSKGIDSFDKLLADKQPLAK